MKYFHYIPITWSISKKYPLYSDYMKYFQKKLFIIFRLHEVFSKKIINHIPITCSISKKVSTIFRSREVFQKNIHYISITWSNSKKNIHNIPITWSISKKNYPLYSDYMKYFQKIVSTIFRLHEVFKIIIHYIPNRWSISWFFWKYLM